MGDIHHDTLIVELFQLRGLETVTILEDTRYCRLPPNALPSYRKDIKLWKNWWMEKQAAYNIDGELPDILIFARPITPMRLIRPSK